MSVVSVFAIVLNAIGRIAVHLPALQLHGRSAGLEHLAARVSRRVPRAAPRGRRGGMVAAAVGVPDGAPGALTARLAFHRYRKDPDTDAETLLHFEFEFRDP